jgi:thiopurine S-methyltransferase
LYLSYANSPEQSGMAILSLLFGADVDANYWYQKWQRKDIAFHEGETNPFLAAHFSALNLAPGSRVFVPLCGKTRDIAWLLTQGYAVVGAELSEVAVAELFAELGVEPKMSKVGDLVLCQANNLDIFIGDIFNLGQSLLGKVNAIYDRAALVALPFDMRTAYTAHLMKITGAAPQLLITFEYDQQLMDGPPFSITQAELKRHYGDHYQLDALGAAEVAGGLKGKVVALETAWLLHPSIINVF